MIIRSEASRGKCKHLYEQFMVKLRILLTTNARPDFIFTSVTFQSWCHLCLCLNGSSEAEPEPRCVWPRNRKTGSLISSNTGCVLAALKQNRALERCAGKGHVYHDADCSVLLFKHSHKHTRVQ